MLQDTPLLSSDTIISTTPYWQLRDVSIEFSAGDASDDDTGIQPSCNSFLIIPSLINKEIESDFVLCVSCSSNGSGLRNKDEVSIGCDFDLYLLNNEQNTSSSSSSSSSSIYIIIMIIIIITITNTRRL